MIKRKKKMYRYLKIVTSLLIFVLGFSVGARAEIALQSVASNLSAPLYYADPNDGSGRAFIVEKGGVIKILESGTVLEQPFLDISSKISDEGERGLLGLAFDPKFKTNRRFFVFYTRSSDGRIIVSSFLANASNKNIADLSSERQRITIAHNYDTNHNGGQIEFGPDGFLYLGVGDGGGGGDPQGNGQNKATLLGKILRIDVSGSKGHTNPSSNPFRGVRGAKGEIFAYGLRNPWRFSFDKVTKTLFAADVGQGDVEEVSIVKSKGNLGWNIMEGNQCFNPSSNCNQRGLTKPIATYTHAEGSSVTGGYVYRGQIRSLRGKYIFGDFQSGTIWTLTQNRNKTWTRRVLLSTNKLISSFGQDRNGEVYVVDYSNGEISKIVDN